MFDNPTPVVVTKVKANGNTYHQFKYQYYASTVYLLLKGSMEDPLVNLFTYNNVSMFICLAYHNNVNDVKCEHVSNLWKGRALSLELHNRGYLLMKGYITPHLSACEINHQGMSLMEVGDWLTISNVFVGVDSKPFIVNDVLTTHKECTQTIKRYSMPIPVIG